MEVIITKQIIKKVALVKAAIDAKLPGAAKTLKILIWDDGDYEIEYRSAINEMLHLFTFHGSVDKEVQYKATDEFMLIEDDYGNEYWVDKTTFDDIEITEQ